mgnify:CR=1 FL=1
MAKKKKQKQKKQHEAYTLLEQFNAAVQAVVLKPETYTTEESKKIAALEQAVYAAAPSVPNKGMGEVLMQVADIRAVLKPLDEKRKQQPRKTQQQPQA